jgi:serine O-acetyltransferase
MKNFRDCKKLIKCDLLRLNQGNCTALVLIRYLITNASFKITFWFRFGSYLRNKNNIFTTLLYYLVFIIHKNNQYKTGIQLPIGTVIGKGLQFSHFSCVVINSESLIGEYCTIFQGVTIGSVRGKGTPIIGNNVVIASGAKILGNVKVGNNVFVGANSVVINDIPDNAIVGGIPAKILNMDGINNVKLYKF